MNDDFTPRPAEPAGVPSEGFSAPFFARSTYVPEAPGSAAPPAAEQASAPAGQNVPAPEPQPRQTGEQERSAPAYALPPVPPYAPVQRPPVTGYYAARPTPPTPRPKPRKAKGLTGRIVALALCCALLGGLCGGLLVHFTQERSDVRVIQGEAPAPAGNNVVVASTPSYAPVSAGDRMAPAQVYQQNVAAVVGITNESTSTDVFGYSSKNSGSGSGFIISANGEIITNYHVIEGAQSLTVTLYDGSSYDAVVLGYEAESDVALLKIDAENLPTVILGDSDQLVVGEEIAAVGNPLGELTHSLTVGYISSLDRDVNTDGTPINMMQIDAAINPGNSGGPLFNMYGQVIGINTAKYSATPGRGTSIEGIGFTIPINDVIRILDDLRENGMVVNRAYIGITADTAVASQEMGTPAGAVVVSVSRGSGGEQAGLQEGDIITAVDGRLVDGRPRLGLLLKDYRGGDKALLTVFRDKEYLDLEVTFDTKPSATPEVQTEPPTQEEEENEQMPWWYYLLP